MADNKSSLVQIAQAVLDEPTQSVKVAISVDGAPVDETNPLPVIIDSQSIVVEVALDKDNDSVTAWQGGGSWSVTNTHITEAVATSAKQDSQITELQAIKGYVDGVETKLDTLITQTDGVESSLSSIDTKVATAAKQDSQITELQAIKGYVDGIETSLTSVDSKVSSLAVVGSGTATSALRVQLADESLTALENISVTVTNTALEITNDAGNPIPVSGTVTSNIGTTNGLALDTTVNSLLKPGSTLNAVNTVGSITNTVVIKADAPINQTNALKVDGSAVTQPISGSVSISGTPSVTISDVATATNQTSQTTELQAIKGNTSRLDYVNRVRLVYSSTNVTTGAWVQLLASVGSTAIKEIEIFDSSGETLELGVGTAGSEVSESYVFPGGNGRIPMQIVANARLAIKAVSATANSGEIIINLYG